MKKLGGFALAVVFGVMYLATWYGVLTGNAPWLLSSVPLGTFYETAGRHLFNFEIVAIASYVLCVAGIFSIFSGTIREKANAATSVMPLGFALAIPALAPVVVGLFKGMA